MDTQGFATFIIVIVDSFLLFILCVWLFCLRVCLPHSCLMLEEVRSKNRAPGTGVLDGSELPDG